MFRQVENLTRCSEKAPRPANSEQSMPSELDEAQLDSVVGGNVLSTLQLQNVMDRHNKAMTITSNIMQKTSQTNAQIIQNIK